LPELFSSEKTSPGSLHGYQLQNYRPFRLMAGGRLVTEKQRHPGNKIEDEEHGADGSRHA